MAAFLVHLEREVLRFERELLSGAWRPGRYVEIAVRDFVFDSYANRHTGRWRVRRTGGSDGVACCREWPGIRRNGISSQKKIKDSRSDGIH